MKRAALATLAVLAVAGCGLDHGTVTAKSYTPESSYTECMNIGNNPCFPMVVDDPECWQIDLRDGDDTGAECITKADWDRLNVGDVIAAPKEN